MQTVIFVFPRAPCLAESLLHSSRLPSEPSPDKNLMLPTINSSGRVGKPRRTRPGVSLCATSHEALGPVGLFELD